MTFLQEVVAIIALSFYTNSNALFYKNVSRPPLSGNFLTFIVISQKEGTISKSSYHTNGLLTLYQVSRNTT